MRTPDRVEADLVRVGELHEEEPVREVRDPEEERVGTSGMPKRFISRSRLPVELEPELLAAVADEDRVDEQRSREVADDDADRPLSSATTRSSVAPTVTRMFVRLAETNATERSSTRKSDVSCS
jgi:hypothetical protein